MISLFFTEVAASLPMRRTSSMLEFPRPDLYSSVYSPQHTTEHVGTSSGLVSALSDRLEEQNRVRLTSKVKKNIIYDY